LRPMAVEIDVEAALRPLVCLSTPRRLKHGKPEVKTLCVRLCGAAGTDSPSQERQLSRVRVQTAAFLQQVPTTIELGRLSAWNCGVLLVT
jgi:hypothetical protein